MADHRDVRSGYAGRSSVASFAVTACRPVGSELLRYPLHYRDGVIAEAVFELGVATATAAHTGWTVGVVIPDSERPAMGDPRTRERGTVFAFHSPCDRIHLQDFLEGICDSGDALVPIAPQVAIGKHVCEMFSETSCGRTHAATSRSAQPRQDDGEHAITHTGGLQCCDMLPMAVCETLLGKVGVTGAGLLRISRSDIVHLRELGEALVLPFIEQFLEADLGDEFGLSLGTQFGS